MSKHAKSAQTLSVREYAQREGVTLDYAYKQVWANRIPGAQQVDGRWQIPASAVKERAAAEEATA